MGETSFPRWQGWDTTQVAVSQARAFLSMVWLVSKCLLLIVIINIIRLRHFKNI